MVDRQDIDALLVGSLYGELSSTEEARLAAHLESHPADRTALADLTRARAVVRESRILQVQFDPPQSISALLMQEAARRAPKSRAREDESWFQRFMRSFIAHPAMAAAAMLVLIIGVAGTVYMRQGDHYAKQTADDVSVQDRAAPAAQPPAETEASKNFGADNQEGRAGDQPVIAQGSSAAPADEFKVTMDDGAAKKDVVVDSKDRSRNSDPAVTQAKPADKKKGTALAFEEQRNEKLAKEEEAAERKDPPKVATNAPAKTAPKPAAPSRRLDVTTPSQGPKDLDSVTVTGRLDDKRDATGSTIVAGGGGASAPRTPTPGNAAPPPPPPAPPTEKPAEPKAPEKPDPLIAWAKEQHAKVVAAVRAGNCQNAANLAVQISNRAPAYYASNVAEDRTVKPCMSYITAQREKEAERSQRAKSTQRRAVDEAPAPAQTTK